MMFLKKLPRLIKWIGAVFLLFITMMMIGRIIFFVRYNPPGKPFSGSAFLMGLRFDIKFAAILCVSILALCALPFLNPFKNHKAKYFWNIVLPIVFMTMLFFYVIDYYHYDYLQQRLNATALNYLQDASISLSMSLESYPVFKVLFALIVLAIISVVFFRKLLLAYQQSPIINSRKQVGKYILFFLLLALGIFGKIGQFNLRWSDAFTLSDNFKASTALNPFQSFFSTLRFRDTGPDITKVKAAYPLMSKFLQVQQPDSSTLNFERQYSFNQSPSTKMNVVVVICESFSMFKSTMSGNPLNTTPFFDSLSKQGVFYDRCFTPSYPTARGVWATITGIPDVVGDNNRTASRNPQAVDQQTIINDFKGYEKFYFLGGDPTWANIKGLLMNNIDSLKLYSQPDFKAPKVDVWGIDDKSLLLESNGILAQQQRPFFAVIQTADNHRPYTIAEKDTTLFKKVNYPKETVIKYGFDDIDQLNAFRYTDYCFRRFIEAAKKEKYFANTVFVFVGDHGIGGNSDEIYPKSFGKLYLTREHVPLLFYAPGLLQPKQLHTVCSQMDVMPSLAGLLAASYRNNSMGQNLFDTTTTPQNAAFIIDHEARTIGMVNDQYYLCKNMKSGRVDFESVVNNNPVPVNQQTDSIKKALSQLTDAYYNTAKYLLYNNKKKQ